MKTVEITLDIQLTVTVDLAKTSEGYEIVDFHGDIESDVTEEVHKADLDRLYHEAQSDSLVRSL